jgi:hypothetical protein
VNVVTIFSSKLEVKNFVALYTEDLQIFYSYIAVNEDKDMLQVAASIQSQSEVQWCSLPINWIQHPIVSPQLESHTWVKLLELSSPYSHDEALLLCQESETEWVAWIPNIGEIILKIDRFCLPVNYS